MIHNDIEDGNTERAGRPSVWWNWGPAQAINAGDGMHAMARLALFGLSEKDVDPKRVASAIRALDEAAVKICEGEYADIANQERMSMTVASYLEMVDDRGRGAVWVAPHDLARWRFPRTRTWQTAWTSSGRRSDRLANLRKTT